MFEIHHFYYHEVLADEQLVFKIHYNNDSLANISFFLLQSREINESICFLHNTNGSVQSSSTQNPASLLPSR